MKLSRRMVVVLLMGGTVSGVAIAQPYPVKPVRVIVPHPPGGSNDIVARIVFQRLSQDMKQQFVMDNRAGADGVIGAEVVAKSPSDGYTLMVHSATHLANAHLYESIRYNTLDDFIGIAPLARQVGVLVVHPSLPVKSVKELIALAKARPNEVNYASGGGGGSFFHVTMAQLMSMTGTQMVLVPYKGGAPAVTGLIAGETQTMVTTIGVFAPHYKAGRMRPLGVTSEKRMTQFPEIPAIAEFVPGYEFTAWIGCFAPAGTSKQIVSSLNNALAKALATPEVGSSLAAQVLDPISMTPEQFADLLRSDYDKYGRVIKASGARIK